MSDSKNLTKLVERTIFDGKDSNFQALGGFRISDETKANNPDVFERLKFESIFKRVATMAGKNNILAVSEFKKTPAAYGKIQKSGAISFTHIQQPASAALQKQGAGEVSDLKSNSTSIKELRDCIIYGCEHNEMIVKKNKFGYGGIDPEVVHGKVEGDKWTLGSNDAPDGIGFITKVNLNTPNNLVYTPETHSEIKLLSLKCSGSGPEGDPSKPYEKNKHKQNSIKEFLKIYLHGFRAAGQGKPGLADAMSPAFKDVNVICGDTNITISKCNHILKNKLDLKNPQAKRDFLGKEIAKALDELYRASEEVFSGFGNSQRDFPGFGPAKWFVVMSNIITGKLRSGFLLPNGQFKKSVPTNIKTADGRKGKPNTDDFEQDGTIIAFRSLQEFEDVCNKIAELNLNKNFTIYSASDTNNECFGNTEAFGFDADEPTPPIVDALSFMTEPEECIDESFSRPIEDVFLDHSVVFVPISIINFAINGADVGATPDSGNIIALNLGSMVNNKKKHWKPDLIPYLPLIYKLDEVLFEYFKLIKMYNTSEENLNTLEHLEYFELDGKKHHETWKISTTTPQTTPQTTRAMRRTQEKRSISEILKEGWKELTNLVFETEPLVKLNRGRLRTRWRNKSPSGSLSKKAINDIRLFWYADRPTRFSPQYKNYKNILLDLVNPISTKSMRIEPPKQKALETQATQLGKTFNELFTLHRAERFKGPESRGGGSNLAKKISKTRTKGLRKSKKSKNRRIKRNKKSLKKRRKNRSRKL